MIDKIVKDPKECRRIWEEDMRKADLEIARTIREYQERERKKGKRK